jgi:hypothetical protein
MFFCMMVKIITQLPINLFMSEILLKSYIRGGRIRLLFPNNLRRIFWIHNFLSILIYFFKKLEE